MAGWHASSGHDACTSLARLQQCSTDACQKAVMAPPDGTFLFAAYGHFLPIRLIQSTLPSPHLHITIFICFFGSLRSSVLDHSHGLSWIIAFTGHCVASTSTAICFDSKILARFLHQHSISLRHHEEFGFRMVIIFGEESSRRSA
jgi:hypothetical protein